jgi:hypothetical protein
MPYEYTIGRADLDLRAEQDRTLASPRLRSNLLLRAMYLTFDLLYGRGRSLPKVKVLELLARHPYWAWENGGYLRITRSHARRERASQRERRRGQRHIDMGRVAQDNEEDHLLLLDDLIQQRGIRLGWVRHTLMPRILAFVYYYLTRLIFCLRPAWSFAMNAAFESHAEHEYMLMAREHPEWDDQEIDSIHFDRYPRQRTLNDLVRRIALDERDHMNHSLEELERLAAGE